MGKASRVVCIFLPYAFTIASLICLIIVGLGCTNSKDNNLNNLYFFRANLKDFTSNSSSIVAEASNLLNKVEGSSSASSDKLASALEQAKEDLNIKDFYDIGLWGYCDGNITSGNYDTTHCSKAKAEFYFNPVEVWNLNETGVSDSVLPDDMQKSLKVYKAVSKWMFIAYIVAFVATVVELLVGVFAICSRWGSCVTSLISAVAFIFTAAASVTSTALFATLTGTFNSALKSYNIHGSMGKNMYVTTWLAVAFSLGATLFWIISSCCCSGRSKEGKTKGVTAEKAPYTYEPLGPNGTQAPYGTSYPSPPHGSVPVNQRQTGYEPFRHV